MGDDERARIKAAILKVARSGGATRLGYGIDTEYADGYLVFTKAHESSRDGQRTVFVLDVTPSPENVRLRA